MRCASRSRPATPPRELPDYPHWRGRGSFAPVADGGAQGPTLPFRFTFEGEHQAAAARRAGRTARRACASPTSAWAGPGRWPAATSPTSAPTC